MLWYDAEHMDWTPLQAVLPDEALGEWMWMHVAEAGDGTLVHHYKHVSTRRYLRLDHDGHVYSETNTGLLTRLPPCGGSMLLLSLVAATVRGDQHLAPTVSIPPAAREPTQVADLPMLLLWLEFITDDIADTVDALCGEPY
jgi:hypothetical protein